jgi:hypothetical protein
MVFKMTKYYLFELIPHISYAPIDLFSHFNIERLQSHLPSLTNGLPQQLELPGEPSYGATVGEPQKVNGFRFLSPR